MPGTSATDPSPHVRPYASGRLIRFLATAIPWTAMVNMVFTVAFAINGAAHAGSYVDVPVTVRTTSQLTLPASGGDHAGHGTALAGRAGDPEKTRLDIAHAPERTWLKADLSSTTLHSYGSTVTEQLLSRADKLVLGLCAVAGSLLLRRLLLDIGQGRPFQPRSAKRLSALAGLIAVGGIATDLLPHVATAFVLNRTGLSGGDGPFAWAVHIDGVPLLVSLLLLALAEAFRRGADLATDVDGLV